MSLPIEQHLPELLAALRHHNTLVLQAPPGAGKTTRVPLALLSADWLAGKRILMLEPRRLAARLAARFMASRLGEKPGQTVGYRTRMDSRVGPDTRLEVVTEGVLTRLLQTDPALEPYAAVLFDEFHERSLQADLGLALARESQQALRPDLRLVIMSATLDGESLAGALAPAPLIQTEGRAWPVEVRYAPVPRQQRWLDHAAVVVRRALAENGGSMLVFLPGAGEIRRLQQLLEGALPDDVDLAPLFGDLDSARQDAAIAPAPTGRRKVVLATAIAETSLTIEGIETVVDTGWERAGAFDPNSGMSRLITRRLSAAASEQRRGRAGRLGPGICYRLWSESEQQGLAAFSPPEILQSDLAPLVLELAHWGARTPDGLFWLDRPPGAAWEQARALLVKLQALDTEGGITDHGRRMLATGQSPRLAHMLVGSEAMDLQDLAADLAALLDERDFLPPGAGADLETALMALRGEWQGEGMHRSRVQRVRKAAERLRCGKPGQSSLTQAGAVLALAYPDRIARRRAGGDPRYQLANGRGAVLPADDPLGDAPWLVVAELDGQARDARIFRAAAVDVSQLEQVLGSSVETVDEVAWDDDRGTVLARRVRRLGALILDEVPLSTPPQAQITEALLAALVRRGAESLPWTPALKQWLARVRLLHQFEPDQWPDLSDAALMRDLADWLGPYLSGVQRLAAISSERLQQALYARLDYRQQQQLDQEAPALIRVPSGFAVPVDYCTEHGPVLAVKLQELFGLSQTPTVARGRVTLAIHLLSPARRPLAVTRDLASFWQQAYPQVRKEMRGRYPKHPWPEDPLEAPAQRGVKRR